MENKDWEIVHAGNDRIDLERGEFGIEKKTVRRPKHMTKPEFARAFSAGQKIDDNTINYVLKKK
jgi:hypothetical protein